MSIRPCRNVIVCAGLLFLSASRAWPQDSLSDRIDRFVNEEMQRQHVPGVGVAVIHHGQVLKARGYGLANLELRVPVSAETLFQSGSLGKQFTATAVMLQVEDGKLALSDPLTKFFPDAPVSWQKITVRNLLTHTSGIPDYVEGMLDMRKDYTEDDLAKFAFGLPLEFPAGSRWNYSNTGYVLLGIIVHKVSGSFYGDVLVTRVFKPLGMTTARVINEADIIPNRAAGYQLEQGAVKNQDWVAPKLNTTADGSLWCSRISRRRTRRVSPTEWRRSSTRPSRCRRSGPSKTATLRPRRAPWSSSSPHALGR
jgi:CubicO group peptidase (beta-lactamase class C family)